MSIKILDPRVASRIAAGEVVERPASVVKELVENALDAKATEVSVEVRGGGTALIRVTDNGSGIPAGEVELAFQRHATSKVASLEDLDSITSLGFRGEALPSIAAVAEVEMVSRLASEPAGTYISLIDEVVTRQTTQGRPPGTTVTVRGLFRRVPARLKFLKSPATENSHLARVVTQYALAFPGVKFTLTVDGRAVLRTPGSGHLLDALTEVYGSGVAGHVLEVVPERGYEDSLQVSGLAGLPEVCRAQRDYLSFFINRRWVTSRLLSRAVEEAYQGLLMVGRYPVAVLQITIPPGEVDVNIHPTKMEVKFRDEPAVFRSVLKAVRGALLGRIPAPRIEEVSVSYQSPAPPVPVLGKPVSLPSPVSSAVTPSLISYLPILRVLGQFRNSYIAAEGPEGLYLIDQHAAHERVLFEQVRQQRERGQVEVQGLLEPVPLEVSPPEGEVLREHHRELAGYGFTLEPFGEKTFLVRAIPALLHRKDWAGALREMLESFRTGSWEERLAASLACHSAVRAGETLSPEEMRELVSRLEAVANPHTCPHGRPTVICLTTERLEREFGRT
ncbi:MAG: DNA mismatch repair endonuclease MutL [Chloroflexota bacterium]